MAPHQSRIFGQPDRRLSFRRRCRHRSGEQGFVLVTSILILLFLSLAGGALISGTGVDVRIADNYRSGVRSLFLAEAGIEAAREKLRLSTNLLDADLASVAGANGNLETTRDLSALLASDDQPWLPTSTAMRTAGLAISDTAGGAAGAYHVWLRNDVSEGEGSTTDNNDVVTLVSIARVGDAIRTVEAVVRHGFLPPLPAALLLNGPIGTFDAASSNNFTIDGFDGSGNGLNKYGIGVISNADDTVVTNEIPNNRRDNYTGLGNEEPNVQNVSSLLGSMDEVSELEDIVSGLADAATDTYNPPFGGSSSIGNIGAANDPRVVVVNGDLSFGPGNGFGILVVRGNLTISGNFSWTGIIYVVGQGSLVWNGGGNGLITGGIMLAKTRDTRTAGNPLGPVRSTRGNVNVDFNGGGNNGIQFNSDSTTNAAGKLPYVPISIKEY